MAGECGIKCRHECAGRIKKESVSERKSEDESGQQKAERARAQEILFLEYLREHSKNLSTIFWLCLTRYGRRVWDRVREKKRMRDIDEGRERA